MRLPLGEGTVDVALEDCEVTVAEPRGGEPVDPAAAAATAVADPHGPRLRERAGADDDVAVVVTDVTRETPARAMLDALFEDLAATGVDREDVRIVVGLGLHRPTTRDERAAMLGPYADLAVDHDPDDAVSVGRVAVPGTGADDPTEVTIEAAPAVVDADLVCSTGLVEPHQYAGFSGGAKTVAVGAGGEPLIGYTHGPELLSRPGVRLGRVADNPFRETIDRAGELVGPEFAVNVTKGPAGVLGASGGRPRRVVRELAGVAREAMAVDVAELGRAEYDAVLAGVGAPKDANLYQASRAATYVVLGANDPLAPDGRVVIPARLPEGAGEGRGERRFHEWLSTAESPASLYEAMREGYEPGAQRAFVLARALCEHDVWITNSEDPALVENCLLHAADRVEDAIEPGSRVLVVRDALNTLLL
jgi:nickel-dependent lactate racemase